MNRRSTTGVFTLVGAALSTAFWSCAAWGQLQPQEVLVVYDSRIDVGGARVSREVAEYYAGSAMVAGGVGGLAAKRSGVRVLDLATTGAPATSPGNISYADFAARLRTPIRDYLVNNGLTREVRCLVLTKGLPHRILDINNAFVADFPNQTYIDTLQSRNLTAASVDSELTLLFQSLNTGEANGNADSKADGLIINPYWKSGAFLGTFTTANIEATKSYSATGTYGPVWALGGSGASRLTAGDMLLVCRLDGHTLADVRGAIDRAQNVTVATAAAALVLDESDSNGAADLSANTELDNSASAFPSLRANDDFESARNLAQTDRRFATVLYNAAAGSNNFYVGSRRAFLSGQGILLPDANPVFLFASYGANHAPEFVGVPFYSDGSSAYTSYASSLVLAPGAIFNTIESFNARDLGGLGQQGFAPQEQVANWLAYGGTFALGSCWEPLADSVPDNFYLMQNFVLGNLTWAEAAWTSVPALSWSNIVIGDPLARVVRSTEDVNGDQRLSIEDLYAWEVTPTDVNRDGSINSTDRQLLVRTIRAWERGDMLLRPR